MPHALWIVTAQASGDDIGKAVDKAIPNRLGLEDWLLAGAILLGAIALAYGVHRLVMRLDRSRDSDSRIVRVVARIAASIVVILGLTAALETLDIDLAPLLAGLGIVGIVIAFAVQDIVANYLAGILIGIRRPFRIGDEIASQEHEGTVEELNFRYTTVRTYDGTRVLLPNAGVFGNPLVNFSVNGRRRSTVSVGVAYGTDVERAKHVLEAAVVRCDGVLSDPAPVAWVDSMGESVLQINLLFWHGPAMADLLSARDAAIVSVWNACEEHGIALPFPQRVVALRDDGGLNGPPDSPR